MNELKLRRIELCCTHTHTHSKQHAAVCSGAAWVQCQSSQYVSQEINHDSPVLYLPALTFFTQSVQTAAYLVLTQWSIKWMRRERKNHRRCHLVSWQRWWFIFLNFQRDTWKQLWTALPPYPYQRVWCRGHSTAIIMHVARCHTLKSIPNRNIPIRDIHHVSYYTCLEKGSWRPASTLRVCCSGRC